MRTLLTVLRIPVDRVVFYRAMAIALPLLFVMVAIKIVKLPTARTQGLFEKDLLPLALAMIGDATAQSVLVPTVCALVAAAVLFSVLKPSRPALAIASGLAVFYLLAAAIGGAHGLPLPLSPQWFEHCLSELCAFCALFWRELVAFVVFVVIALWYGHVQRQSASRARACIVMVATVLMLLVLAIDAGYFASTRAEISSDEFLYMLRSPGDALTAARDGWSREVGLLFALPWVAFGFAAVLRGTRGSPAPQPMRPTELSLGLYLWPIVLLAFAAPSVALDQRMDRLTGNILFRLGNDLIWRPTRAAFAGQSALAASSVRVPELDLRPIALAAHQGSRPLNVVMILLESVRADATSVYSPSLGTTPFLLELARDSLVVDQMYANVPRTSAAWVATITGRFPTTVSVLRRWAQHPSATTFDSSLAAQLRQLGYATGFFTTTRLDFENDASLIHALGFEQVVSAESLGATSFRPINNFGVEDRALLPDLESWLDAQAASRSPFFLTIMTNAGHYPYTPPAGWPERRFTSRSAMDQRYLNSVAYIDTFVRNVVDDLKARELLENTLLIVMGDHGEAFNEHGLIWHTAVVYEEGLHVPAIIRLPGTLRRGGRVAGLRQQIDLYPTIVEALGLEARGGTPPGKSLLSDPRGHQALFFSTHFDDAALAMRDGNRKYIYRFGRRPTEVYDLAVDPAEARDIAASTRAADVMSAEADMRDWYSKVKNSYLVNAND